MVFPPRAEWSSAPVLLAKDWRVVVSLSLQYSMWRVKWFLLGFSVILFRCSYLLLYRLGVYLIPLAKYLQFARTRLFPRLTLCVYALSLSLSHSLPLPPTLFLLFVPLSYSLPYLCLSLLSLLLSSFYLSMSSFSFIHFSGTHSLCLCSSKFSLHREKVLVCNLIDEIATGKSNLDKFSVSSHPSL